MTTETAYSRKWVCHICGQYYDLEQEAKQCSESHEELEMIPEFVIGKEMPYLIRVLKKKGNEIIKSSIYREEVK